MPIIFLARRLADLLERVPTSSLVAVGGREAPVIEARSLGWLPFWAALPIAPAGIYAGAFVTTLVLQRLQPWAPVR